MLIETSPWSPPAPAGSLLLWEEAGIDSLAQTWQPLLFLPAQHILLEWAFSVSMPAMQSDCIGGVLASHSLEAALPSLPMCDMPGSHPLLLLWLSAQRL